MQQNVPAPLYRDPIFDSPADPMVIRSHLDGRFYLFYTQRRATAQVDGVSNCYGTAIGVAQSDDGGAHWHYRGALDLDFEFGHNTFWAPEIVFDEPTSLYHMFVTYIQGVYMDWGGDACLEHYISRDLFTWEHQSGLSFGSSRIIDPCLYPLPSGGWRMWYKDENQDSHTCYADSPDLYHWTYGGQVITDCRHEGPNVFALGGYYWMLVDVWQGQGIYRSEDLLHFTRQTGGNLLESGTGTRPRDNTMGRHADVYTVGDKGYVLYFTHPNTGDDAAYCRTCLQMAQVTVENGRLVCDRNKEFSVDWRQQD